MRKLFQKEWHNIRFDSFSKISSSCIADAHFYSNFYKTFFNKYNSADELDPAWIELKLQTMNFLRDHAEFTKEDPILSIGCGLGIIERKLIDSGFTNVEVTEVSVEPLRWLVPHISPNNIHIGPFPECLPHNKLYNFIYLSNVEYFFSPAELKLFLRKVRDRLAPLGACVMLSCACESMETKQEMWENVKDGVKFILDRCGVRNRGQLWGYKRDRKDFLEAMSAAEFIQMEDGFLEKKTNWDTYWIKGRK